MAFEIRGEVQYSGLSVVLERPKPIAVIKMTRSQAKLMRELADGYVAEQERSRTPGRKTKRWIMRHPRSHETDGRYVMQKTIDHLMNTGFAVMVYMPYNDKTWVFDKNRYLMSPTGSANATP